MSLVKPWALKLTALLAISGFLTIVGSTTTFAATINVTTTTDENTDPGTGCSLYEAIVSSNTDVAYGSCTAGSGVDTIALSPGTYNLSTGNAWSNLINITQAVTFTGNANPRPVINASTKAGGSTINARVPDVSWSDINLNKVYIEAWPPITGAAANFTAERMDITNRGGIGSNSPGLTIRDITYSDNSSMDIFGNDSLIERVVGNDNVYMEFGGNGYIARDVQLTDTSWFMSDKTGGSADNLFEDISVDGSDWTGMFITAHGTGDLGKTTLRRVTATNNNDDGIGQYGTSGGVKHQLIVENAYIANNLSLGMYSFYDEVVDQDPTLIVRNSLFENNGTDPGVKLGGIFHGSGYAVIENTSFINNTADQFGGGGVFASGRIDITNSTFSGNQSIIEGINTQAYGGAIMLDLEFYLDGAYPSHPSSRLTNITVTNNTSMYGSGIYVNNYDDTAGADITSSLPVFRNVLNANNVGVDCEAGNNDYYTRSSRPFTMDPISTNNLSSDGTCLGFSLTNTNPLLDTQLRLLSTSPLTGFKESHTQAPVLPLLDGSPAIDAGTMTNCPATDQRGSARPADATCDIGAYEGILGNLVSAPVAPIPSTPAPNSSQGTTLADTGQNYFEILLVTLSSIFVSVFALVIGHKRSF